MELIKLGDLFKITSGGTPSKKNNDFYENGNIPWVKTGDLKTKDIWRSSEKITDLAVQKSAAKLFPSGTVLIAMYGATIGATSILRIDATTNQACCAFLPSERINSEYLYYFFRANKNKIVEMGVGGAQPNISATILKEIKIPYVELDIQNNIVNILNKANDLIEKRRSQIENLDELVKSQFIEMFGNPLTNSKKQNLIKLNECIREKADLVDGPFGSSVNTKVDYIDEGEIPVIRTKNVNMMSFNSNDLKFMTREKYESVIRSQVLPGDIILTKVGTIGNVCIFPEIYSEAVLSTTGSCRIRVDEDKINKIFLAYYLVYYREKLLDIASAGVQPFLNMNHVKNLDIFEVEYELQNQFANFVKQTDKLKFEIENILKGMSLVEEVSKEMNNKIFN